MKRLIFILLTFIFLLSVLSACGNNTNDNNVEQESSNTVIQKSEKESNNSPFEDIDLKDVHPFSEGLSWITFYTETADDDYLISSGCIDKNGNLLFYLEPKNANAPLYGTEFKNGLSYIKDTDSNKVYVINKKGEKEHEFDLVGSDSTQGQTTTTNGAVIYGDGYIVNQKYESSFDGTSYSYEITDLDGKVLKEIAGAKNEHLDWGYQGNGIFSYMSPEENNPHFYFSTVNKEIGPVVTDKSSAAHYWFGETKVLVFCGEYDGDVFLTTIDKNGIMEDIEIPEEFGHNPVIHGFSDKLVLLENENEFYYICNLETKEFIKYSGKYVDNIYWAPPGPSVQEGALVDDVAVLPLEGQDEKRYMLLVDSTGKEITEPILGKEYTSFGEYLVADQALIYDKTGKTIGSFEKIQGVTAINDDTIHIGDSIYSVNGKELISLEPLGINFANAKQIKIVKDK